MANNHPSQFSETDLNNADIKGVSQAEGIAPTLVNNGSRARDAVGASYYKDLGGTQTVAGTADVITVTGTPTAYVDGQHFVFTASGANTVTGVTLNWNSLGAKDIKKHSGGSVVALAVGDIKSGAYAHVTYDGTQFILTNTGELGGGLENVVDDTTPQLGGQLDVNGNAIGDGTLEILTFTETGSAVNEIDIANAATGNGPTISATGDDTNVDLNLAPKGSGLLNLNTPAIIIGSDADGDIYYRSSGAAARLAKGTADQVLTMNAGATAPEWAASGGMTLLGEETFGGGGDLASVIVTGFTGYNMAVIIGTAGWTTSPRALNVSGRTAAGTWREWAVISDDVDVNGRALLFHVTIGGLAGKMKSCTVTSKETGDTIDSGTSFFSQATNADTAIGWMNRDEIWDEIRVAPEAGSFENATAGEGGLIQFWGA